MEISRQTLTGLSYRDLAHLLAIAYVDIHNLKQHEDDFLHCAEPSCMRNLMALEKVKK